MSIQFQNVHSSGGQALASHSRTSGSVHVRFVLAGAALEEVFLSSFGFPLIIIIPPFLDTHVSTIPGVCHSPDQATHYN
jgi:hypothetical protein